MEMAMDQEEKDLLKSPRLIDMGKRIKEKNRIFKQRLKNKSNKQEELEDWLSDEMVLEVNYTQGAEEIGTQYLSILISRVIIIVTYIDRYI